MWVETYWRFPPGYKAAAARNALKEKQNMTIDKRHASPMKGGNAVKISGPSGPDPRTSMATHTESAIKSKAGGAVRNQGKGAGQANSVPGRSARGK